MPHYAVGDRVELVPELGGWSGLVVEQLGGPGPDGSYRVARSPDQVDIVAPPHQITRWLPPAPPFAIGERVMLGGAPGRVTAIDGDLHTVEIVIPLTTGRGRKVAMGAVVYERIHKVPAWRLALEQKRDPMFIMSATF